MKMDKDEFKYLEFKIEASSINDNAGYYEFKCGNIFISNRGKYTLICEFCNHNFENMDSFGFHLESKHLIAKYEELEETDQITNDPDECIYEGNSIENVDVDLTSNDMTNGLPTPDYRKDLSLQEDAIEYIDIDVSERPCATPEPTLIDVKELPNFEDIMLHCEVCDRTFTKENAYSRHINFHKQIGKLQPLPKSGVMKLASNLNKKEPNQMDQLKSCEDATKYIASELPFSPDVDAFDQNCALSPTESLVTVPVEKESKPSTKQKCKPKKLSNSKRNFYCEICNRYFGNSSAIKLHSQQMHIDTIPNILIADSTYRSCKFCRQSFEKVSDRIRHESSHNEEKKYSCSFCSKKFTAPIGREGHENRHRGVTPFKCPLCPKSFPIHQKRSLHVREEHLGIKIACEHCDMSFDAPSKRDIHMRTHMNQFPYQCELCGRCFRFAGDFKNHLRRHENKREYKCDVCGMAFNLRALLIDHKAGHSSERPFVCETCGLSFQRKRTLRSHRKLHSGIKAYECAVCGKRFAQATTRNSHLKIHDKS